MINCCLFRELAVAYQYVFLKSKYVLALLSLITLVSGGCISIHSSPEYDSKPITKNVDSLSHPMIVFNPPLKISREYKYSTLYYIEDNNPLEEPYLKIINDNIMATGSYPKLAQWCHTFYANKKPFYFTVIDRRVSYPKAQSSWDSTRKWIMGLSLITIPVPMFDSFRCEQASFCSLKQDSIYAPLTESPEYYERWYGAKSETYVSIIPFVGWCIPPYRKYWSASKSRKDRLNKCSALAHFEYKESFMLDAVAQAQRLIGNRVPEFISDESFSRLVKMAFKQSYDPVKAYVLKINLLGGGDYDATVNKAGDVLQGLDNQSKIVLQAGHLYVVYRYRDVAFSGNMLLEMNVIDLGAIRELAPVISSWIIESGLFYVKR